MRKLGRDMSGRVLNAALQPVQQAVGQGIGGLVASGVGSLLGGMSMFADGAAFSAGRVRAFAGGGVVEGPTLFPMRGGTGLMGEAGPEAILPLTRGADGRLGVASAGGGGGSHITVNISSPDVESFRRSRGQVASTISRAAAAGRRNM
jgi:lambda family phage tail tape measure protein